MKIMLISNDGGGFADRIDIEAGTTVAKLFADKLPGKSANNYLVRVNRQPVVADQILQPEDRVSITPTKIEGAF